MRYVGPILRAVTREISKMPDVEIVSVETSTETVSVIKRGRNLIIDVDTPDEEVHVTVPIKVMESVAHKMDRVIRHSTF